MANPRLAVVVDHWPLVRLGIARVVERAGLRVAAECDSGRDAVERCRRAQPGLVVVGSDLTDDPVLTVAALAEVEPASRVVVLVHGGEKEQLSALLDAGADAILVRTAGPDELADAVRRVLAGERVLAPALLPALVGMVTSSGGAEPAALSGSPHRVDGATLTSRERAVLSRLAGGGTNRDIAAALYLSEATVKTHLSHIYAKLGVTDRQQAVARALALRLLA